MSLSRGSVPCEFATRLALDAGIDVIKVEPPEGDPLRMRPGPLFSYLAAGKQSVCADRGLPQAIERVIEGCHAVAVDAWGQQQIERVEPRRPVVLVGEHDAAALDGMPTDRSDEFLTFHATGLGYLTPRVMPGYPSRDPLCPRAHLIEFVAGLYGAIALLALLQPGTEEHVATRADVGLTRAALPLLRREVAAVLYDGASPHRSERIWKVSPAEVHRCRDGWVFVDVIEDVQWLRLCAYMERPDLAADPRYATRDQRFAGAETLCAILDAFFATRSKSCWREAQARGIPVAPVDSLQDLVDDPQLAQRGFWSRVQTVSQDMLTVPETPLSQLFRGSDGAPRRVPALGEHNDRWLRSSARA